MSPKDPEGRAQTSGVTVLAPLPQGDGPSRAAMQRSLDGFMTFYNHQRPHQGYRLLGRRPGELFWGAAVIAS